MEVLGPGGNENKKKDSFLKVAYHSKIVETIIIDLLFQ